MKDFFISYTKTDKEWAEWIAWILEEAGYSVIIQAWDFRPGGNFILDMHEAASATQRTVIVLSENYLTSAYTQPEWAAAFIKDPKGEERKIIPIRVQKCTPPGLLTPIVYIDLIGLSEQDAQVAILGAFSTRAKPAKAPKFPGDISSKPTEERVTSDKVPYPGSRNATIGGNITDTIIVTGDGNTIMTAPIQPDIRMFPKINVTAKDRLQLAQNLSIIPVQQFNILLFALSPPPGLIPSMPASQSERVYSLLIWAESPDGCGLENVQDILADILKRPTANQDK